MYPQKPHRSSRPFLPLVLSSIVLLIAILVLIGWQFNLGFLKRPIPNLVAMNPLTAVLFIVINFSFIIGNYAYKNRNPQWNVLLAWLVLLITSYHLMEIAFDFPLKVDQILYGSRLHGDFGLSQPNRTAPNTAICFLISSIALLQSNKKKNYNIRISQYLSLSVFIIGLFGLIGYLYSIPEFYGVLSYIPMAIHTALCFLIFSLALLLIKPKKGIMKAFSGSSSSSWMIKILIPSVLVLPMLFGYLYLVMVWGKLFSMEFALSLVVIGFTIVFTFIVIINSALLSKNDMEKRKYLHKLTKSNIELHHINSITTSLNNELQTTLEELASTNEELSAVNNQLNLTNQKLENANTTIREQSEIIIQQKNSELTTYRNNLDIIFTNTQEGILLLDDNGREYVLKFQEVLANPGKLVNILTQVKHKNGHWLWIEGTAVNLFHLESVKGIVGTFRDVTQQVSMEEEARQNAFFREKANEVANIGYGIAEINSMGEKITWSQEALQILGLNKEEYDGSFKSYLEIVHPDDLSIVRRAILHAVNVSGQYSLDHRIIHSNGAIRWVHDIAEVKKDKDNSVMIGILQDITERKEIELILKEFNERYDILSKATNDAIWDWDIPNDFQLWNHGLQTIFGYRETIIKQVRFWIQKKIHPDDFNTVIRSLEDSFTLCQSNWSAIYRYQCYDGTYKHVQDRAYILYDKNHKPIRAIGAMQDITKQYYSTLEIKKLSLVASSTDNAVVITDTQDNIEWVNQSFEKLTGFTLAEVEGKNHIDLLRSTDMPEDVVNNIQLKLTRRESITAEINNTTRSGKRYWFKLAITPVLSVEGELQNYVSIYTDISNQKDYENKLTSIAQELQGLIENSNVPIFGIDVNGIINEWNHITATITEYSKNEALGQPWTSFLEVKYRDTIQRLITKILKGKSVNNFELPILSKSGGEVILLLSASPRWDAETVIKGVIIVAQNITELSEYRHGLEQMVQERTRELNIALQKEKELVVFKSRFVSIASHEFKTPLTTISLASGFLRKYKQKLKPEDIDEKLNAIDKQIDHMNYLLEDVLTIGKSESGKIDINLTSIDIKSFFTSLTRDIQQGIPQTNRINLTIKNFKSTIMTDPKMLRVIVVNLLTNAIKFSPINTAVELEVRYTKKHLLIKIIDYGLGIPSKDIDNLFTSFYRGSNVGAIQGTGLGLSIVKKTVDLLKGWVKVESKVGHGSTFTISLPTLL